MHNTTQQPPALFHDLKSASFRQLIAGCLASDPDILAPYMWRAYRPAGDQEALNQTLCALIQSQRRAQADKYTEAYIAKCAGSVVDVSYNALPQLAWSMIMSYMAAPDRLNLALASKRLRQYWKTDPRHYFAGDRWYGYLSAMMPNRRNDSVSVSRAVEQFQVQLPAGNPFALVSLGSLARVIHDTYGDKESFEHAVTKAAAARVAKGL
jgi:hypothetical protein